LAQRCAPWLDPPVAPSTLHEIPALHAIAEAASRAAGWLGGHARALIGLAARHTGVPAVLVAAVALVIGLRVVRKLSAFFIEVGIAVLLLVALSEFGLITW